jgi:peptidoglycan hydrolase-like protein with peptidoglycan-binding domain
MRTRRALALPLLVLAAAVPTAHAAAGSAGVAALQVGLRAHGLYAGAIDGISGPQTSLAVRRLQRHARIAVDGVAGPQTRRALGRFGRHTLGSRPLRRGLIGWDVAALQFQLAVHGFPSGGFDGIFGPRVEAALARFQEWAGLHVDGVAGPATLGALTAVSPTAPLALAWPLAQPVLGDLFGPRGDHFHSGVDFPAAARTPCLCRAQRAGRLRRVACGWLGLPCHDRPRQRRADDVRAPVTDRRTGRRVGGPGRPRGRSGSDRKCAGPAPPLRGARTRRGRRPADGAALNRPV